ncbi:hypothetical protein [Novosphingobium guangzhouense]|uniref:Uncharacterized protein n=1 Tax=Novosphingobium guangzhouense TaxID=1850347 RepID=A0A2K2FUN0_9SPHN|nr:hypothetical protein [Novosphingobium guangzhouense]PNU02486.1 hypothetical protein A8V01_08875 [Novosphingobium guangzhouense]
MADIDPEALRKAACAIWAIQRQDLDKCDMELDDVGDHYATFKMAKAALACQPGPTPAAGEPVAWRYVHHDYMGRRVSRYGVAPERWNGHDPVETHPLYAHPTSSDQETLDAARYRWLRDHSCPPHNFYIGVPDEFSGVRYGPSEVDAYIDDARARQNGGEG